MIASKYHRKASIPYWIRGFFYFTTAQGANMKIENGKPVFESDEEKAAFGMLLDSEVKGLKSNRDALIEELKTLKPLKGIDPEEYSKLKKQAEEAEEDRMKRAGEFDKLKQQMADAHAKELQAERDKNATLQKSLEENVLIAQATQALASEKGSVVLLMPHIRSRTKLDETGNPVVLDESGNVRVDSKGKPMTIQSLVAEMKADVATYGRGFDPVGASGGGTNPNHGGGTGLGKFDHLSPAARIAAAREAGIKE